MLPQHRGQLFILFCLYRLGNVLFSQGNIPPVGVTHLYQWRNKCPTVEIRLQPPHLQTVQLSSKNSLFAENWGIIKALNEGQKREIRRNQFRIF